MTPDLQIAIIGCGFIGQKRARSIGARATIKICCDVSAAKAEALAKHYDADITTDWQSAVTREDVDVVLIGATPVLLAPIAWHAVSHGGAVLMERPGARRAAGLGPVAAAVNA